uniref:Uncharacterized protein n=1 Tax=Anguilla anguilla TaxID=7936 RepID=A0A0E9TW62_ANGAN
MLKCGFLHLCEGFYCFGTDTLKWHEI